MAEYLKENAVAVPEGNEDVLGPGYCLPHTVCYRTPSGEGKESRLTGTMATDTAAEPEGQPTTVAVAPVKEKKSKTKSILIGGDEEEAGSSKPVEETGPVIITWSLSLGEPLLTWLL